MDACVKRLAKGVSFRSSMDAGGTGALCDSIWHDLSFSFGSGLCDAAVRVEELLAGFDVPGSKKNYSKSGDLETMDDVWEATTN